MKTVYVGVFNPVTNAHVEIAEAALKYSDEVIFVPVSDRYFKETLNCSSTHRLNMLKLALHNEKFRISRIEIDSDHQNKTIETLNRLKELYHEDLILLIGGDNLKTFSKWFRPEEILQNYKLLVVSREESLDQIIKNDELLSKYEDRIIKIDDFDLDISSNLVRNNIINGLDTDSLIPFQVEQYIKENNLYKE